MWNRWSIVLAALGVACGGGEEGDPARRAAQREGPAVTTADGEEQSSQAPDDLEPQATEHTETVDASMPEETKSGPSVAARGQAHGSAVSAQSAQLGVRLDEMRQQMRVMEQDLRKLNKIAARNNKIDEIVALGPRLQEVLEAQHQALQLEPASAEMKRRALAAIRYEQQLLSLPEGFGKGFTWWFSMTLDALAARRQQLDGLLGEAGMHDILGE